MISKTNMTIQDYFNLAGLKPPQADSRHGDDFGELLNRVQNRQMDNTTGTNEGLRLADYLKSPIIARSKRSISSDPIRCSPALPMTLPDNAVKRMTAEPKNAVNSASEPILDPKPRRIVGANRHVDQRIADGIQTAAARYNLSPELIYSVIHAESNFQPDAASPAGAQGLMQLMPGTAKELGVEDPFNIEQNIDGGSRYLRQMLDMFDNDIKKALSAYNAGPGNVAKYNGHVPFQETRNYIRKVMELSKQYSV